MVPAAALFPALAAAWAGSVLLGGAAAAQVIPVDGQVFTSSATLAPGTYNLPHGVSIGASFVTLDMNGAVLVGTSFNNYGVTSIGHDNVVIRNGTCRGYFYGVRVESG